MNLQADLFDKVPVSLDLNRNTQHIFLVRNLCSDEAWCFPIIHTLPARPLGHDRVLCPLQHQYLLFQLLTITGEPDFFPNHPQYIADFHRLTRIDLFQTFLLHIHVHRSGADSSGCCHD